MQEIENEGGKLNGIASYTEQYMSLSLGQQETASSLWPRLWKGWSTPHRIQY